MKKVQYVVTVWDVINADTPWEDCFEEEYTGERYDTREEARGEFLQAKDDTNFRGAFIREVYA